METIGALKHHALEVVPARERLFFAPVVPRGPFRLEGPRCTASNWEEFSRTVTHGASEKCAKASTDVHIPYTTFPQGKNLCKCGKKRVECGEFEQSEIFQRGGMHRNGAEQPEENSRKFLAPLVGPFKFVNAEWVRTDEKSLLLNKDDRSFEARTFRRVHLIFGAANAVLIEMHDGVVQTHP